MGGGGTYYTRDVSDRKTRVYRGVSKDTEAAMSNTRVDKALLTVNRTISCSAANPVLLPFDVTGSMGQLPKMFRDRMPNVAYQMQVQQYLPDSEACLAAVGDCVTDSGPMQVADFSPWRGLDPWLGRLWLEGNGGGQAVESYEMFAWYAAYKMEFNEDAVPFCIFTGDEGFREILPSTDLNGLFGGKNERMYASQVFADLRTKFRDNVFLIHRKYSDGDAKIVAQWSKVLGPERVVVLPEDAAIADLVLGILAIMGGSRTLDGYCDDMASRINANTGKPEPQTPERIEKVRNALSKLSAIAPAAPVPKPKRSRTAVIAKPATKAKPAASKKPADVPAKKKTKGFKL